MSSKTQTHIDLSHLDLQERDVIIRVLDRDDALNKIEQQRLRLVYNSNRFFHFIGSNARCTLVQHNIYTNVRVCGGGGAFGIRCNQFVLPLNRMQDTINHIIIRSSRQGPRYRVTVLWKLNPTSRPGQVMKGPHS